MCHRWYAGTIFKALFKNLFIYLLIHKYVFTLLQISQTFYLIQRYIEGFRKNQQTFFLSGCVDEFDKMRGQGETWSSCSETCTCQVNLLFN